MAHTAPHAATPDDGGGRQPEPDAPVPVRRQVVSPLPMPWSLDATAEAHDRRRRIQGDLLRQLRAVLAEHGLDESVDIDVTGALVSLHGTVGDPLTLQLVEDLAWSVPAVVHLDNRVRIAGA